MPDFNTKKNVLITGASSGIGLELAKLFAQNGFRPILVARRRQKLTQLAQEIESNFHQQAVVLTRDLSRPKAPREIFEALQMQNLPVDILVNNAGFGALGQFVSADTDKIERMIQVNVTALTILTRLFLPGMLKRGYGKILNVASTAAFQPGPEMAVYYATKAFVLNFSEAISYELKNTPVTVTALCPGPTRSEFQSVADMGEALVGRIGLMSAEKVARIGYRALFRGKHVVIPGLLNRSGAWLSRHAPRRWVMVFIQRLQENRNPNDSDPPTLQVE